MNAVETRRVSMLIALVVQNTSLVFATKLAYREHAEPFRASSAVVASELLKVASCASVLAFRNRKKSRIAGILRLRFAVHAGLYVVQSNLIFMAVKNLPPAVYMACSQSKIITTAIFSVLLLKKTLNRTQVFSIIILTFGMVLVQLPQYSASSQYTMGSQCIGLLAIFSATITSGYAGVYLESLYKSDEKKVTIVEQNIRLATFALPLAVGGCLFDHLYNDQSGLSGLSLFHGFDCVVIIVVVLQALGGLIVSGVMKYASSLVKCYAVAISICISMVISFVAGFQNISKVLCCGISLILFSTFSYARAS